MRSESAADRFSVTGGGHGAVLVDLDGGIPVPDDVWWWASLPFVVVGLTRLAGLDESGWDLGSWRDVVDVVVGPDGPDVDDVETSVTASPIAATTLAMLLRGAGRRTVTEGLVAESAAYSTLQAGSEFDRWRRGRPTRERADAGRPRVRCIREHDRLDITLTRPEARNALDATMRDALHEALLVAQLDHRIEGIDLRGDGPSFCAGGDLDEMGRRPDPASAHLIRLHRSLPRLLSTLAGRTTAHLHGACAGSGIELPAFAGQVLAAADTTFALPEIGLGLVPGAGGTVSLPARIGRHRTAWLAFTGRAIDAPTAVAWGLADEIAGT